MPAHPGKAGSSSSGLPVARTGFTCYLKRAFSGGVIQCINRIRTVQSQKGNEAPAEALSQQTRQVWDVPGLRTLWMGEKFGVAACFLPRSP